MAAPPEGITALNKSPLVQLLTTILLVIAFIALLVRLGTKFSRAGRLSVEDHLASLATLAAIAQSIAVIVQSKHGLGKLRANISPGDLSIEMKSQYAASALFVAAIASAKLSFLASVASLSSQTYKRVAAGGAIFILLWSFSALFVVLFQCHAPQTWNVLDNECIDSRTFWTYFSALDILTELAILVLLVTVTLKIRTTLARKLLVMGVFGNRVLLVPALAVQIVFSTKAHDSGDVTFTAWKAAIASEVVQCLAIVTVCLPYLKPFLESLESGQMRIDGTRHAHTNASGYKENEYRRNGNQQLDKAVVSDQSECSSNISCSPPPAQYELPALSAGASSSKAQKSGQWPITKEMEVEVSFYRV